MPLFRQAGIFNPHESHRAHALEGSPLAPFGRRFSAVAIDFVILALTNAPVKLALQYLIEQKLRIGEDLFHSSGQHVHVQVQFRMDLTLELLWTLWLLLYFGLFLRFTNGLTPGKRLLRIRVVSLTHDRLTFWQSVERALGYGASALEGGFGFLQYFLNPNHQCAHDRLAETIVVRMEVPRHSADPYVPQSYSTARDDKPSERLPNS
jgi:uncharacterized RDD family membrane protein YckC